jgi:hypothetical protein
MLKEKTTGQTPKIFHYIKEYYNILSALWYIKRYKYSVSREIHSYSNTVSLQYQRVIKMIPTQVYFSHTLRIYSTLYFSSHLMFHFSLTILKLCFLWASDDLLHMPRPLFIHERGNVNMVLPCQKVAATICEFCHIDFPQYALHAICLCM